MTNYKPFEKELHDRFDGNSREIAANFLISTGDYELETALKNQPEAFEGYDFYIRHLPTGQNLNIEVERKLVWNVEGRWKYPGQKVHISARKAKSRAHIFIMLNDTGKTLLFADMKAVTSSQTITKNTWNKFTGTRTKEETFFALDIMDPTVGMYVYNNGSWGRVL